MRPRREPAKPAFSPTRLAAYLRCPQMYHFAYVLDLAKRFGRARAATSFGGSLHRSLQMMAQAGGAQAVSADDLAAHLSRTWVPAGYATPEEERRHLEEGRRLLETVHAELLAQPVETLLVEKMVRCEREKAILRGKLDRLDRLSDGSLEVVDYKSGRAGLCEADVFADIGLMVYELCVREHYPGTPVRVAIHALRPNLKVSVARSESEFESLGRFLDGLILAILEDREHPTRPVGECPDCDFRSLCPAWRSPRGSHA